MKNYSGPVTWYYRTVAKYLAPPTGQSPVKSYEMYAKSRHTPETSSFEELAKSPLMVCGDVDFATHKLAQVTKEYGFNELLCWTRIRGMENRMVLRSMELMSGRVMPEVRKLTEKLAA